MQNGYDCYKVREPSKLLTHFYSFYKSFRLLKTFNFYVSIPRFKNKTRIRSQDKKELIYAVKWKS